MYLEFTDGTQLECIRILGGPRTIEGITRDCLSIEVDANDITHNELIAYFSNPANMAHLYTRETKTSDRQEIGEGYLYAVDVRTEHRKDPHTPGLMVPETYRVFRVLNIAQLTYAEYQLWINGQYTPPEFEPIDPDTTPDPPRPTGD